MNRGRLRRYALGLLAAGSLGVTLFVTAGGIAHADTITGDGTTSIIKTIDPASTDPAATDPGVTNPGAPEAAPAEANWE